MYYYRGHNGSIAVGDGRLEITRSRLVAKLLGLESKQQVIQLAEITGIACQRPAILTNGYLRLATNGRTARQLWLTEANSHPDTVTFTHGQRADFDKLVSELQSVISANLSTSRAPVRTQTSDGRILGAAVDHIPRSERELTELATYRPEFWEYRLFAGLLLSGMENLADKWHDHEFRYARQQSHLADARTAGSYLSEAMARLSGMSEGFVKLLTPRNNLLAFGPPGVSGDPNRIRILAARLIEIYEAFLDWASELRSMRVPEPLQETFEIAAELTDEPLGNIRTFITQVAVDIENIIDLDERGLLEEHHEFTLALTLTIDPGLLKDFTNSLDRAKKKLGI